MSVSGREHFVTLIDLLQHRAQRQPEALAYRFLPSGDIAESPLTRTYGELAERAGLIGARLAAEAQPAQVTTTAATRTTTDATPAFVADSHPIRFDGAGPA